MAQSPDHKLGKALDHFTGTRDAGAAGGSDFPGEFARVKLSVIRPVFDAIGELLKERGHTVSISEAEDSKISIHIVPAGVDKSFHPYDWFPTLSFFAAPFTKTIGLHGRNMRPNSEPSSGSRGDYKPGQVTKDLVEKELMKFIGEIANW